MGAKTSRLAGRSTGTTQPLLPAAASTDITGARADDKVGEGEDWEENIAFTNYPLLGKQNI